MAELARGNRAGYEAACVIMADRVTPSGQKPFLGEWCIIACDAPNPPEILRRLLAVLEAVGVPSGPSFYKGDREGAYYAALGALTMRLGRHQEAIQHLEKARTVRDGSRSLLLFLAMAHFGAGHAEEGKALLENVRARIEVDQRLFDLGRTFDSYGNLAIAKLLLREAEEMMR
jgi:hypothetical protein